MERVIKKPELLAPAGNPEKGRMALLYGADAIYLGGRAFGLRAFAGNFSNGEIAEICTFAHSLGKKVYVTVNIFAHNADLQGLPQYLTELAEAGVDALLVSDLGVWQIARQVVPQMPLHVSTQANTTNYAAVQAWERLGAQRVVLARELSLAEIAEIAGQCHTELEVFVHGAMCISYSGRCLLSSYLTGRDSNRGACAQACRWNYALLEEKRPGEYFAVEEDARGTYIMNSRDLCLLAYLPQLLRAGVSSLKIEGRMKSVHYVATVVSVYRRAIDACCAAPEAYKVDEAWQLELEKVSHRPYTTGFALGRPGQEAQVYTTSAYVQTHDFVALVTAYDADNQRVYLEQRNHLAEGELVEALTPAGAVVSFKLEQLLDAAGEHITCAPHAQMQFSAHCAHRLPAFSLVRRAIR